MMEMFDEIAETRITADGTAQVRTMHEQSDQSEAMREACGVFLTAEKKFRKLNANPDCQPQGEHMNPRNRLGYTWPTRRRIAWRAARRATLPRTQPRPRDGVGVSPHRDLPSLG